MRAAWFALGTFSVQPGDTFAGLVVDGRVARLDDHLGEGVSVRTLLEEWESSQPILQALADRLTSHDYPFEADQLRPLPPVQSPGQLFQAGANYKQHLIELMGANRDRMHHLSSVEERREAMGKLDERMLHGRPYVFLSMPYSLTGANDDVVLPPEVRQPDWELELAAVIGRTAHRVPRERAFDFIAGYTICNDITARDRVFRPDVSGIGTDWLAGKGWPTFTPVGPYLVPAVHVGDPQDLRLTLRLNGKVMQDSGTDDMMFGVARLLEHASSITELRPGDLLLTGSPGGNGVHHGRFLQPGDVIESEITGLGRQCNRCVAMAAELPLPRAELGA